MANQKKADALVKTLEKYKDGKTPGEIQQLRMENRFYSIVRSELGKGIFSRHPEMQAILNRLSESEKKNSGMIEWLKYAEEQHKLGNKFARIRLLTGKAAVQVHEKVGW